MPAKSQVSVNIARRKRQRFAFLLKQTITGLKRRVANFNHEEPASTAKAHIVTCRLTSTKIKKLRPCLILPFKGASILQWLARCKTGSLTRGPVRELRLRCKSRTSDVALRVRNKLSLIKRALTSLCPRSPSKTATAVRNANSSVKTGHIHNSDQNYSSKQTANAVVLRQPFKVGSSQIARGSSLGDKL